MYSKRFGESCLIYCLLYISATAYRQCAILLHIYMLLIRKGRCWSYKMGVDVKIEVFHKERITPSSPTPHHLRNFTLSIFDQFPLPVYVPLLLFYPNSSDIHHHEINKTIDPRCLVVERSKLLKRSLSETLTRFYPFAGRVVHNNPSSVDCNDKGVMFLEAQVTNCSISKALESLDLGFVKDLLPDLQSAATAGDSSSPPILVQANFFECGGVAIGIQVSHRVIDAFTLSTFLNSWSATSRGLQLPPYQYAGAASRFPPLDPELFNKPPQTTFVKSATRRFLFESSEIESLKFKAASAAVQKPTRVEVVSALIWKCAMKASNRNSDSTRRRLSTSSSSAWLQTVNMRKILAGTDAENWMGNLLGFFAATSTKGGVENDEDDLQALVASMRKASDRLKVKYGGNTVGVDDVSELLKGHGELLQKNDIECYISTSWCKLPFYETDFGWGKPLISSPATEEMKDIKNVTILMDASDGCGIQACLTLKEEDMAIFEKDEELLAYASLNPTLTSSVRKSKL